MQDNVIVWEPPKIETIDAAELLAGVEFVGITF